jgi:hypothetical protein
MDDENHHQNNFRRKCNRNHVCSANACSSTIQQAWQFLKQIAPVAAAPEVPVVRKCTLYHYKSPIIELL